MGGTLSRRRSRCHRTAEERKQPAATDPGRRRALIQRAGRIFTCRCDCRLGTGHRPGKSRRNHPHARQHVPAGPDGHTTRGTGANGRELPDPARQAVVRHCSFGHGTAIAFPVVVDYRRGHPHRKPGGGHLPLQTGGQQLPGIRLFQVPLDVLRSGPSAQRPEGPEPIPGSGTREQFHRAAAKPRIGAHRQRDADFRRLRHLRKRFYLAGDKREKECFRQIGKRPSRNARRPLYPQIQHRRTASAVQHPARRHVGGRQPAAAALRGGTPHR